jgi:hypothetical protein
MKPQSTIYEIRVAGQLSTQWADWFEGFAITAQDGETRLTGAVADQAALFGLLKRVRDLGLPLISVNQLPSPEPGDPPDQE